VRSCSPHRESSDILLFISVLFVVVVVFVLFFITKCVEVVESIASFDWYNFLYQVLVFILENTPTNGHSHQ